MTNKPGDIACARPNNIARVDCRVRRANTNVFPVPLTALSAETSKRKISLFAKSEPGGAALSANFGPAAPARFLFPSCP
jgi:hypothetical protein